MNTVGRVAVAAAIGLLALTGCSTASDSAQGPPPAPIVPAPVGAPQPVPGLEFTTVTFCLPGGMRVFENNGYKSYAMSVVDVSNRRAPDPWACP